ncbi:MAG: thiolase family protein [Dehalococcoidales bacterium]|nr:thiolase family protein [Dehalococcoidales bacterium]
MERIAVVSAVRSPIGGYLGALREVPAYDMVAAVINEAVKRAGVDPADVEDVIFGQCYQSGEYVNVARRGLLQAGWPETVPGITVDRRCTSGLDALVIGAMEIQTGVSEIVVAGGVETMSTAEFYIPGNIKWGIGRGTGISFSDAPRGHGSLKMYGIPIYDRIQRSRPMHQPVERFGEIVSNVAWAENVAKEIGLTREDCDKWALRSHQKAIAAQKSGKFKDYIVPISVPQAKGEPKIVDTDEGPREDTSLEALAKLKPILGGVCTAGNSSQENDAAAGFVLMSESQARKRGLEPLAYLKSWSKAADDPRIPPRAGNAAFKKALEQAGLTVEQIDLFEIQEAFAAQCLYNIRSLGIPEEYYERINVNGSGISLGHPLGATLALRVTALVNEMKKRNARYGLVGTPGAGGIACAAVFERI